MRTINDGGEFWKFVCRWTSDLAKFKYQFRDGAGDLCMLWRASVIAGCNCVLASLGLALAICGVLLDLFTLIVYGHLFKLQDDPIGISELLLLVMGVAGVLVLSAVSAVSCLAIIYGACCTYARYRDRVQAEPEEQKEPKEPNLVWLAITSHFHRYCVPIRLKSAEEK